MSKFAAVQSAAKDMDASTTVEMTEKGNFMKEFFDNVAEVRTSISNIEGKIDQVAQKHGQALASISDKQHKRTNEEIDQLMSDISSEANKVRSKLKTMDRENKEFEQANPGSPDARIRTTQHATLSRKFVDVMTRYNDVQTQYKAKYTERVKRQLKIVQPEATQEEIDKEVDQALEGKAENFFLRQMVEPKHAEAKQALEEIQDRHKELLRLERSIKELHELFVDMAILVESQGEMVDRIEFSVAKATDYTEGATEQLKQATALQSAARRKKIAISTIILLVIAVVVIYFVVKNS
eukprot:Clim_evm8s204 gene=Clim_evmTU8s204